MGEVGIETNVHWLIVRVMSVPEIIISGHLLFKLSLKMQSHVFLKHSIVSICQH